MRVKKIADLSQGWHSYGEGLYCRVQGDARAWILRFQQNKIRKVLTLGDARFLNLQGARDLVFQLKKDMASGAIPFFVSTVYLVVKSTKRKLIRGRYFPRYGKRRLLTLPR